MWSEGPVINDQGEEVLGWIYFAPHHDKKAAREFGGCVWFQHGWYCASTFGGHTIDSYETIEQARNQVETTARELTDERGNYNGG